MRVFSAILVCSVLACAADAPRRAPGFALIDTKQRMHDLYDYRGKVVILEFMQTTCPHCAAFTSVLAKVQQKYGERVQILAVANPPDNPNTVNEYITGHKITYPVLFDIGQVAYSYVLAQRMDLPQVYVIDANGIIQRHYEYGPLTRDIFEGNGFITEIDRVLLAQAQKK